MWNFVAQMTALLPEVIVPQREWPNQNLREACPVDQGNSGSDNEGSVTLAGLAALIESQAKERSSLKERAAKSEATLSSILDRNAKTVGLSEREKEKRHKMRAFSNTIHESRASDLL